MIYLFLLFLQVAFAVSPVRIAVLEFRGINIEESALTLLADDVREGVLIALKNDSSNSSNYLVMTRENMMSILNEMGKGIEDCTGECEVEIARNIGADYVVSGEVYLIEDQYILSLKMHDTQAGNLFPVLYIIEMYCSAHRFIVLRQTCKKFLFYKNFPGKNKIIFH